MTGFYINLSLLLVYKSKKVKIIIQKKETVMRKDNENKEISLSDMFSKHLMHGHIQILENLYVNYKVVSYKQIWNTFRATIKISDRTLRKRIKELSDLGLINCVKSYEILIEPKKELKDEILAEIQSHRSKLMMQ